MLSMAGGYQDGWKVKAEYLLLRLLMKLSEGQSSLMSQAVPKHASGKQTQRKVLPGSRNLSELGRPAS